MTRRYTDHELFEMGELCLNMVCNLGAELADDPLASDIQAITAELFYFVVGVKDALKEYSTRKELEILPDAAGNNKRLCERYLRLSDNDHHDACCLCKKIYKPRSRVKPFTNLANSNPAAITGPLISAINKGDQAIIGSIRKAT